MASGYSDLSEIRKDGSLYAIRSRPPKINLLNEKPRRESVIERQLHEAVTMPTTSHGYTSLNQQQVGLGKQQVFGQGSRDNTAGSSYYDRSRYNLGGNLDHIDYSLDSSPALVGCTPSTDLYYPERGVFETKKSITISRESAGTDFGYKDVERLGSDAQREKLKKEIAYKNQHQNPWSRPRQIREPRREPQRGIIRRDQRWVRECPSSPSSRPTSRASSTRSTTEEDLMKRVEGLLQDAEEMEKRPLMKQHIIIESGPRNLQSTIKGQNQHNISSVHTATIKVPRGEVNNKSPLPFAYDNFSTLGVRGNIASVGAAEPDTPYPPIFPTIKRTPSPANR